MNRWFRASLPAITLVLAAAILLGVAAGPGFPWQRDSSSPSVPATTEHLASECQRDPAPVPRLEAAFDGRPFNYLHTCGNRIYDAEGREVKITGINWYGMETGTYAPHGLWTRNWKSILDQIVSLGYNTVRLPFSNEALESGRQPQGINYTLNPDLYGLTSLEIMDRIIQGARERGLKIVLDRHRPDSRAQSTLWYNDRIDEGRWIADWRMLAKRYRGNDTVIGMDLHNEPGGDATWGTGDPRTDWRLAAENAGNAILEENPYVLIFVEGIGNYEGQWYWFGGNLKGAGKYPIRLKIPNRVVYSPHDYGPGVYLQGWFLDPNFPDNLQEIWDTNWGYLHRENIAPVVVGEFGGRSVGNDREGQWQRALVDYMRRTGVGYITWSLNPDSSGTGGLLGEDWQTVRQEKQSLYSTYLAPPLTAGDSSSFGPPSSAKIKLLYKSHAQQERTNNISFILRIINDGAVPLKPSRLEIRYWFTRDDISDVAQQAEVDWAALGRDFVEGEVRPAKGSQDSYLRLTFREDAPAIPPYSSSGDILLRIHKSDWTDYLQTNDFSFLPTEDFQEASRITIYLDGRLIAGNEP